MSDGSVAYGFEALMVNEFHNLQLVCVPPQLIPPYGPSENQGCALPGSTPGSTIVNGLSYLQVQFTYMYSHLWRNVGILFGFWVFFVAVTLFSMERIVKPQKGAGNTNVYKSGCLPTAVRQALESPPADEERQQCVSTMPTEAHEKQLIDVNDIAKTETIFTWSGIRYVINVKGEKKVLLDDVQGYVKPGRLTALMGGIPSRSG